MDEDKFEEEVRISGSGKVSGGSYGKITVSGSGEITGDVEAREISVAGSAKFEADVDCRDITVTGTCRIYGNLEAEKIVSRGSLSVDNNVRSIALKSYGSLKVGKDLTAEDIYLAGSSEIKNDLEAESFVSRGSFSIEELLTADKIDVWLGSKNRASEVGGGVIEITKRGLPLDLNSEKIKDGVENLERGLDRLGDKLGFNLDLDEEKISSGITKFGKKINYYVKEIGNGRFESSLIEGDEVILEGVKSETVRGSHVQIGEDCVIDKVEFSDTIEIDEGATVKKTERL